LAQALGTLLTVARGSLLVDDTGVVPPSARLLIEAAWVWATQDQQRGFGGSLVL
jgi:hypothetical protein